MSTQPLGYFLLLCLFPIPQAYPEEIEDVQYTIRQVEQLPQVTDDWSTPAWEKAETLTIDQFHKLGSGHTPKTQARLLHDGKSLAVTFRVEDQYVVARHTQYQSPTHKDSCVEFFVQPEGRDGYFNFEMNAGGTLLLWYVEDPRRIKGKFSKYTPVPKDLADAIEVHASLPKQIDPEIEEPVTWTVSYRVPLALFKAFAGPIDSLAGQRWRGNFYKCADESSHPHWGYWADVGARLDFHQPKQFAPIIFE